MPTPGFAGGPLATMAVLVGLTVLVGVLKVWRLLRGPGISNAELVRRHGYVVAPGRLIVGTVCYGLALAPVAWLVLGGALIWSSPELRWSPRALVTPLLASAALVVIGYRLRRHRVFTN